MSSSQDEGRSAPRAGLVRGPQSVVSGFALLALAALALWLSRDLPSGTLRAIGPGLMPRWLAYGVGACGLALVAIGLVRTGTALERWTFRGPVFVILAILAFALTIRPTPLGAISSPGLGLAFAGPLSILIAGYATPEARLRELLILGLALTAGSMLLFGDLLNLPIPLFPQALADLFPEGWSQRGQLRVIAAVQIGSALAIFLLGGRGAPAGTAQAVATQTGQIR